MKTVSEFVIERLREWGVRRVFGYPGDGIGEFDGALGKTDRDGDGVEYVRPTHEEVCALMATAHAKFTGEVGVCIATSSPGAFHLLNGLYDAQMDNQPVVAIVGQQGLASFGTAVMQESNLERVFADVAVYVQTIVTPEQAPAVIDTAFRAARVHLGPAVIVLPHDVQGMPMPELPRENWVSRSSAVAPSIAVTPPVEALQAAADLINAGSKVTFMVGAGARGATDELLEAADRTGAGIVTALRGKDVVPSDVPHHTQQLGLLGTLPSKHQMDRCDTLVLIGTNYPYPQFLPETGQARAVQIDLKPEQMGLRYPTEVNLWGDAKATLTALIPLLEREDDRAWQERIAEEMGGWEREVAAQADVRYPDGVNPRHVVQELNVRLPPDAVVTTDVGTTADWYGHHIRLRRGMQGDISGRNASMFSSMPYAVAAKFAFPDRPVVCMIGDGAFQMLGMNELITVKKYRERWADGRFVVIVMHNDDLSQVSWEMRTEDGNPVYAGSQDVESVDYAGWAQLLGFTGVQVRSDDDVVPAIEAALAHDGITLIDAYVTKNIAPLPAHISFEFAKNTAKALLKGDPRELGVIVDSAEGLVAEQVERVKGAFRR